MAARLLIRPAIFTVCSCSAIFGAATYIDIKQNLRQYERQQQAQGQSFSWPSLGQINASLFGRSTNWVRQNEQSRLRWLQSVREFGMPQILQEYSQLLVNKYFDLNEYERISLGIMGVNAVIFLGWQISSSAFVSRIMQRYFLDTVEFGKQKVFSLIGSSWSHYSLLHIGFNMYALNSILPHVAQTMSAHHSHKIYESQSTCSIQLKGESLELLSFFTCAGIVSTLSSRAFRVFMKQYMYDRSAGSLGASGALYGVLAFTALTSSPDTRLQLIFLPMLSIPILTGFKCLVAFDTAMLLRQVISRGTSNMGLDHAGHLGGAAFGYLYLLYDNKRRDKFYPYNGGNVWNDTCQTTYKAIKFLQPIKVN